MIFGKSTDILLNESSIEESNELLGTFTTALQRLGLRIVLGRLWLFSKWDKTYADLASKVHTVVDRLIDEALERVQESSDPAENEVKRSYVIVDELVRVTSNREEIRNQLLNFFLPTRDAAAVGLSGALFHLARHPDVFNKLRAEVLSIKGPVTYDVLQSLTYMRAVLNESVLL
jgi:cytochrome P450